MSSTQITTLTFFRYKGIMSKIWAFGMMQFANPYLAKASGLQFYKLMGSGRGLGFNLLPDWSTYALLCTWDNETQAVEFLNKSELFKKYNRKANEIETYFLANKMAKGYWSGKQPFETNEIIKYGKVAVITRATIKWTKLYAFWKYVPTSQRPLKNAKGLVFTKGIGEVPILQMATFSIWESEENLKAFAYGSKEHSKAIKLTKLQDWYKEELFSRFTVVRKQVKKSNSHP